MGKEKITLSDGDGMQDAYNLIRSVFLSAFSNPYLNQLTDAASIGDFVFTCDSFTVKPIFFPGSDIGKLSVYGTVNDICVSAAVPLYLSLAIVVEEGFSLNVLKNIVSSIKEATEKASTKIVSGDFKVVEKNKADGIFITTSGVGKKLKRNPSWNKIKAGDKIIITGGIAEHGITVLLSRNRIFDFNIESDCRSLADILIPFWKKFPKTKFMRDPTRGGLASVLNEIVFSTGLGIRIFEESVPLGENVKAATELLGVDPFYLASEGQAIIIVPKEDAKEAVKFLHGIGCEKAAIIGNVTRSRRVIINTIAGGERLLDFSYSLTLPRIC